MTSRTQHGGATRSAPLPLPALARPPKADNAGPANTVPSRGWRREVHWLQGHGGEPPTRAQEPP
eukprot:11067033-Alexandrium_andersonii.AAC.1